MESVPVGPSPHGGEAGSYARPGRAGAWGRTQVADAGRLTWYLEKRAGALARLIEAHGIIVLTKPDWDAKKAELGDTVLD